VAREKRANGGATVTVYFIQAGNGGPIKIGYTGGSARSRTLTLQTGNHVSLTVLATMPGGKDQERYLQKEKFAHLCMRGEWFLPEPALVCFIDGVLAAQRMTTFVDACFQGDMSNDQVETVRGLMYGENLIRQLYEVRARSPIHGTPLEDYDQILDKGVYELAMNTSCDPFLREWLDDVAPDSLFEAAIFRILSHPDNVDDVKYGFLIADTLACYRGDPGLLRQDMIEKVWTNSVAEAC
jgi:hypothetical protein